MEEITLDNLLESVELPQYTFSAVYDPETGMVIGVGPTPAFSDIKNKIEIDQETAEMIVEGKILMETCFIDLVSDQINFVETKTAFKIDDVLHRIPEKKWTDVDKIDLYIEYNSKSKTLKFRLSEEYQGTKKLIKKYQPVKVRRIKWSGDTQMDFLITDYNDPNIIYSTISFSIDDIVGKDKIFKDVSLTKNQSIYTRRLFENCVVDYK